MKKGILLVSLLLTVVWGYGQSAALEELLNTDGVKNAAVSVSVKRVNDGKEIVACNAEMALTPASVAKILPTWFALQEKGVNYRYRTNIFYTGEIKDGVLSGDIIVPAAGDPTLDSRFFPHRSFVKNLVAAIQRAGIQHIGGRLLVEGAEKGTDIPGSWVWEDISNYYGAIYLPFNYRDNTCVFSFQTGVVGSVAKLISVYPALPGIEIQNEVKAAAANRDNAWVYGGPYSTVICVKGTLPANRKSFKVKAALHDPAMACINELKAELSDKGIRVESNVFADTTRTQLVYFDSPRLEEIVFHTNKASVNLFAEAMGKLAGGKEWQKEVSALLVKAGINTQGITLYDACGLSPLDALPARVLTDLLVYIGKREHSAFLNSLPLGGVDGGLSGYCHAYPQLNKKLQAKTGSMSGVRSLSGYLTNNKGERLAFTILINHYTCTVSQLQRAVGKFLSRLME